LRAFSSLPSDQQTVLRCAYHGHLTQREIARRTSTPLGTIRTRLELGLQKRGAFLHDSDDLAGVEGRHQPGNNS